MQVYDRLLNTLRQRCMESRRKIGDIAVRSTQLIERDYGKSVTARRMLEEMELATQGFTDRSCASITATLIPMIGGG